MHVVTITVALAVLALGSGTAPSLSASYRVILADQGHTEETADTVEQEWQEYHAIAYAEYSDEFTALFNGYKTRWSRNGRLMLRNGDSGPYKFAKRSN